MYDVKGKGARNKIAKRRLDMIDGNIESYSRLLNDPKRLKSLKEYNELTAAVASVSASADAEKEKRQLNAKKRASDKEAKKQQEEEKEATKKEALLPKLTLIMEGVADVDQLASQILATLRDIV
jgi:hypothetical protein